MFIKKREVKLSTTHLHDRKYKMIFNTPPSVVNVI